MIHVALIIERADPRLGGAERSIAELADALRTQGLACTIVAATGTASNGLHVLRPGPTARRTPLTVLQHQLQDHLAQAPYDLVHSTLPLPCADVYQPRGGAYTAAIRQNAAAYERPWAVAFKRWTHSTNRRRAALLAAERRLCRGGSTIVAALSNRVARDFRTDYDLPEDRLVVIPNAVRPPDPPAPSAVAAFRTRLGLHDNSTEGPILLFAANNFRLKGLGPLLKAWSRAVSEPPSADPGSGDRPGSTARRPILAVAGSGRIEPYRRLATRLGIAETVVFPGPLETIGPALAACRAAVLPTWYDPCSRFILEALAMAKPVITTRFNGAAERFAHGRHGWIIDRPDDIDALTEALRHALDPDRAEQAHQAILQDDLRGALSIEHHARLLIELYERLLRKRKTPGTQTIHTPRHSMCPPPRQEGL